MNHNFFTYSELLKIENLNDITKQNFTLDELKHFADFIVDLTAVGDGLPEVEQKELIELKRDFDYWADDYEELMSLLPLEVLYNPSETWIDERFTELKIKVADMAWMLVYNSRSNFFKDIYK